MRLSVCKDGICTCHALVHKTSSLVTACTVQLTYRCRSSWRQRRRKRSSVCWRSSAAGRRDIQRWMRAGRQPAANWCYSRHCRRHDYHTQLTKPTPSCTCRPTYTNMHIQSRTSCLFAHHPYTLQFEIVTGVCLTPQIRNTDTSRPTDVHAIYTVCRFLPRNAL